MTENYPVAASSKAALKTAPRKINDKGSHGFSWDYINGLREVLDYRIPLIAGRSTPYIVGSNEAYNFALNFSDIGPKNHEDIKEFSFQLLDMRRP